MIRLNKYIAMSGVCSRRKADELIDEGKVKVNNVVSDKGTMIDEKSDRVSVDGRIIKLEKKKIYIMLNKPEGYVTTNDDQFARPCVIDLIREKERVFPVGRLDMETEGLLLLTNDGEFSNKLMHPSNKVDKVYVAKIIGEITEEKITKLKNGVDIGGFVTSKAKVKKLSKDELEITIHEGKNRQVRKMCEAVDLNVIKLKRTKIGNLELGYLEPGKYKLLSFSDIKNIVVSNNLNNNLIFDKRSRNFNRKK